MASTPLGLTLLIVLGTALMVGVIGAGFYRRRAATGAKEPGNRPLVVRLVGPLLAAWLLLAFILAATGFFVTDTSAAPPRVAYALIPLVLGFVLFAFSPGFRRAIDSIPAHWLVGVQVYRLEGAVFLIGYALGLVPGVFALPAGWGDVAIGLTAPTVAYLLRARHPWSRRLAIVWNVVGIVDLVVAVTLGVLTAPGRLQRLALDSPNSAIAEFPFVLIPTVLVPISILLHSLSLRSLAPARSRPTVDSPSGLAYSPKTL